MRLHGFVAGMARQGEEIVGKIIITQERGSEVRNKKHNPCFSPYYSNSRCKQFPFFEFLEIKKGVMRKGVINGFLEACEICCTPSLFAWHPLWQLAICLCQFSVLTPRLLVVNYIFVVDAKAFIISGARLALASDLALYTQVIVILCLCS